LVAQGGFLELEGLGRRAELQVRRAVEPRADVLQILLDVPERERHGGILNGSRSRSKVPSVPRRRLRRCRRPLWWWSGRRSRMRALRAWRPMLPSLPEG